VRDAFVLGSGNQAVDTRKVEEFDFPTVRKLGLPTVTPGKFATFWRRPVRRLKSVDFPEFGGPTIATVRVSAAGGPGASRTRTELAWQSLIGAS
jgi:hypothetical protein